MKAYLFRTFFWVIGLFGLALPIQVAYAQNQVVDNGVSYLKTAQSPDGSWGNDADLTVLDTSTVLDTFKLLNISDGAYSNGVVWLGSQSSSSTDFLSRKIISLSLAGVDVSADVTTLINSKNPDGGWGEDANFSSSPFDTALALQALKATTPSDPAIANAALAYLLATQNPDGGFGFYAGDDSNLYMTALVSATILTR